MKLDIRPLVDRFLEQLLNAVLRATPEELAAMPGPNARSGGRSGPPAAIPARSQRVGQEIRDPGALLGPMASVEPRPTPHPRRTRKRVPKAPARQEGGWPVASASAPIPAASLRQSETLIRANAAGIVLRRRRAGAPAQPAPPYVAPSAALSELAPNDPIARMPSEEGAPQESAQAAVL